MPAKKDDDAKAKKASPGGFFKCVVKAIARFLPSPAGLTLILAIFTLLGGAIFYSIEAKHEKQMLKQSRSASLRLRALFANEFLNTSKKFSKNNEAFLQRSMALLQEYEKLREQTGASAQQLWGDFYDAIFYSATVYTTIGYGNAYPRTKQGKIFTVVYAIIGIPLCLVVLAELGKCLTRAIKTLFRKLRSSLDDSNFPINEEFDFSIVIAVAITVSYLVIGAIIYDQLEPEWSLLDAFYFIFISGSTIGFGDLVPSQSRWFFLGGFLYTLGALILVSAIVAIMQGRLDDAVTATRTYLDSESAPTDKDASKVRTKPTEEEVAAIYGRQVQDRFKALEKQAAEMAPTVAAAAPASGHDGDDYEMEVARIYGRPPNSWQGKGRQKPKPSPVPPPKLAGLHERKPAPAAPARSPVAPPKVPTGKQGNLHAD